MRKILSQKKLTGTYSVFFEALDISAMAMRNISDWESVCVTTYLNTAPLINVVPCSQAMHWLFD